MTRSRPSVALAVLALALLSAAGIGAFSWWGSVRFVETTNNAYVRADIVRVSAQIEGYVSEVIAEDNQTVAAGDLLVRIQPDTFEARLNESRADLTRAEANVVGIARRLQRQQSLISQAEANLDAAAADHALSKSELERARGLVAENFASAQQYERAIAEEERSRAIVAAARANQLAAQQELAVLDVERESLAAEVEQKKAALRLREIELAYTAVRAPISGKIGNRSAQTGQFVRPGMHLLAIVPMNEVWIEANFKETQLARVTPGQPVKIAIDSFPGATIEGRVESLSPASGAEFSLLPPQNASGNFSKIVQRIPIRIALPERHALSGLLRPGMSAVVSIDTADGDAGQDGSALASSSN